MKDLKTPATEEQPPETQEKDQGTTKPALSHKDTNQKFPSGPPKPEQSITVPSRSSTPKAAAQAANPAPGTRQDSSRPSTLAPAPGLPSRPEVPFPAHFTHDKFGTIRTTAHPREHRDARDPREPTRDARDPRDPRDQRQYRSGDDPHPARPREHQLPDRRLPEPLPREPSRSERERPSQRPEPPRRNEQNVPERDNRPRDRAPPAGQAGRGGEPSRDQRHSPPGPRTMPPPPHPEAPGPSVNPDRARMISSDDRPDIINPARAAVVGDGRPSGHQPRDDTRNRTSSRTSSPRPTERPVSRTGESPREDSRSSRPHRPDHNPRDHRNESSPAQPRGSRFGDHHGGDRSMADRTREPSFSRPPPPVSHHEPDEGRLSHPESSYGRLNAIPSVTDGNSVPDGPRGRGRNMARGPLPHSSAPDTRFHNEPPRPRSPDRHQPPTGPASSRSRRGQPSGQFTHGSGHPNSPAGTTAPAPGIHPERLRQLNANAAPSTPTPPSYPASTANSVPVHPDRMNHIATSPGSSGSQHRGRTLAPLQTSEKPPLSSGPPSQRPPPGAHSMSSGPANDSSMSAPTGPAANNDRTRTDRRR